MLACLLARAAEGFKRRAGAAGRARGRKTPLLDDTVAAAMTGGMRICRLTGVESETQFGYAALHQFLLPFHGQLERPHDEALL